MVSIVVIVKRCLVGMCVCVCDFFAILFPVDANLFCQYGFQCSNVEQWTLLSESFASLVSLIYATFVFESRTFCAWGPICSHLSSFSNRFLLDTHNLRPDLSIYGKQSAFCAAAARADE